MGERIYWNNDWQFTNQYEDCLNEKQIDESALFRVRIPHTVKETPYHYFDESEYQMVSGYRKCFFAPESWEKKHLLLTFEGVGHVCEVFLNGEKIGEHGCGYTAFTIDLKDFIKLGEDNILVVKVDSRESVNVPPFGFVIDYMTYGGIYRDVYLDIKEPAYIEDVFVKTKLKKQGKMIRLDEALLLSDVTIRGLDDTDEKMDEKLSKKEGRLCQYVKKKGQSQEILIHEEMLSQKQKKDAFVQIKQGVSDIQLWDIEDPVLYEIRTELWLNDEKQDEKLVTFGFRSAVFRQDGFYLNGRKVKIRGLNRHQSYAYVGYAMPKSMQQLDADILKKELGLNAVRTSHYPQSHYFLDRCDELGLLVFTEMPGWQHIGDEQWKNQAVKNMEEMILEYRNHTSIILWGARINESVDDDEFYTRTNALAHKLDPTRQTGGVRCYKESHLLEDVYTYNDFLHDGKRKGCDEKEEVTSDMKKGYLISEYNGHMFPTKAFDCEEHRVEHALRHANVLDEVAKQKDIAGSFGWCMFDYNTHKDFGSGDRICYHGVMDLFRNPKLAADIYASLQEETPVLSLSSSMDIGEHPGCNRGKTYLFTNADSVKLYKNGEFIKEFTAESSPYKNLSHGPIVVDDYIGDALEKKEGFSKEKAQMTKEVLNEAAEVGLFGLRKKTLLKAGMLMMKYHMEQSEAVELYNKYIGDWGGAATEYRFDAIKDGKVVKSILKKPMSKRSLSVWTSHTSLAEGNSYDVAAIRITCVDENGNLLPYANDPIMLSASGAISIIGPKLISLHGGMGGTYVKTTGEAGTGELVIETADGICHKIHFTSS